MAELALLINFSDYPIRNMININAMKFKYLFTIIMLLFLIANCTKRDADNPYDPECSPEIWRPQALKASTSGQMTVTLSWTMSTSQYDKVCIDRIRQGGEVQEKIASINKSSSQWTDNTLIPDKNISYEYQVYAIAGSNESSRVGITYTPGIPSPKDLDVQRISEQKYKITWSSEDRGKNILERKTGNDNWIVINDNINAKTSGNGYFDETVPMNQSVSYRVCLIVEGVQSAYSESQAVTTILNAPGQLITPVIDDSKIQLQWQDNSETEEGFRIYRKSGTDTWVLLSEQKVQNLTTFTDNSIPLENRIYYRISSFCQNAESFSGEVYVDPEIPSVTTGTVDNITENSATCTGNVSKINRSTLTAKGLVWGKSDNPTLENKTGFTNNGTSKGEFTGTMTGLGSNEDYYVRAYATNGKGTAYGVSRQQFKTIITLPTVITSTTTATSSTTATSGGNVTNAGTYPVTSRGVCWSTASNPTIANSKTSNGSGTGSFTSSINGLNPNTTYYIRAYATSSAGTSYGSNWQITTPAEVPPTITTLTTTATSSTTASSGGNVTNEGSCPVTSRGVCWSTSPNPTVELSTKTVDGTGTGSFSSTITGLICGTTYYIRAYAINCAGTTYGNTFSFIVPCDNPPTVSTSSATNITNNSAISGGNVINDGGKTVTSRGVCWGTSTNPTIANSKTTDGSGTGNFISSITGLNSCTTYYIRAYATNSAGLTGYGGVSSFTTNCIGVPTVTTATVTSITTNSATSGGSVTNDGGATVTSRGVCWSTATNPTIANSKTTDGSGTGNFISSITGLNSCTTYYIRAYATNSAGLTGYGGVSSFTANCIGVPTVTTATVTSITTNSAISGGSVTNDGGATVTSHGVCWSTAPNPTVSLPTKTVDGSGTGSFTSSIKGLSPNTKYYVRSYATNSVGTGYGSERNFTTEAEQNDFYISNATVTPTTPTTVAPGEKISVSCDQKYNGNSAGTLDVYVGYYLSSNTSWGSSDIFLGDDSSKLSATDTSDPEEENLTIPSGTPEGTYYILFVADYKKEYNETNENNNIAYKQIYINPLPYVDLTTSTPKTHDMTFNYYGAGYDNTYLNHWKIFSDGDNYMKFIYDGKKKIRLHLHATTIDGFNDTYVIIYINGTQATNRIHIANNWTWYTIWDDTYITTGRNEIKIVNVGHLNGVYISDLWIDYAETLLP
ncbi:MAG: hypothetical protein AB2L24_05760 [Mangrovibacterium sp.]